MAKVSLARKKELNEPDAFIDTSNQVAQFIQEHKDKVIGAIVAFFLIIFGILVLFFSIGPAANLIHHLNTGQ